MNNNRVRATLQGVFYSKVRFKARWSLGTEHHSRHIKHLTAEITLE